MTAADRDWLRTMLARNASGEYLLKYGSPGTLDEFRDQVPLCSYEDLLPWISRAHLAPDVLFSGRPVGYERTGGSSSGTKLIPYSAEGLVDFQRNITPWLVATMRRYRISGSVYFSTSPATRKLEAIGDIPVGLPDTAYLGQAAGEMLLSRSAVPSSINQLTEVESWRRETLRHLAAADDLELISVWSPTFLLRLLEQLPDAARLWPRLKVISCWASGAARKFADELHFLLPQAEIQPKGLLSTETVVTVPDEASRPVLAPHGFWEFEAGGQLLLEDQLQSGRSYEVIATTASGLYRYRTGDFVRFEGSNAQGRPILEFLGRNSLNGDLVGEKLTEAFVNTCLLGVAGHAMLVPCFERPGYVLVCDSPEALAQVADVEHLLRANPQYAYARSMDQLAPLRAILQPQVFTLIERHLVSNGVRLGDVKPLALRSEAFWLRLFEEDAAA